MDREHTAHYRGNGNCADQMIEPFDYEKGAPLDGRHIKRTEGRVPLGKYANHIIPPCASVLAATKRPRALGFS